MSLRDRIKERKNFAIICESDNDKVYPEDFDPVLLDLNSPERIEFEAEIWREFHLYTVIRKLATQADISQYIRDSIKKEYFLCRRKDDRRPVIAAAITECKNVVATGGIKAGQEWCMKFYIRIFKKYNYHHLKDITGKDLVNSGIIRGKKRVRKFLKSAGHRNRKIDRRSIKTKTLGG